MLNYQSAAQLKKLARIIEQLGAEKGRPLKLGEALDALSKGHGYPAWSAFAPQLSAEGVDGLLDSQELEHLADAEGDAYGPECTLQVQTGFMLKTAGYPEACDYVRVCDPLGREIAYWHADEWQQEPAVVMGAIIGALSRGAAAGVSEVSQVSQVSEVSKLSENEPSPDPELFIHDMSLIEIPPDCDRETLEQALRIVVASAKTLLSGAPLQRNDPSFWPVTGNPSRKGLVHQIGQMNFVLTNLKKTNEHLKRKTQAQAEQLRALQARRSPGCVA